MRLDAGVVSLRGTKCRSNPGAVRDALDCFVASLLAMTVSPSHTFAPPGEQHGTFSGNNPCAATLLRCAKVRERPARRHFVSHPRRTTKLTVAL